MTSKQKTVMEYGENRTLHIRLPQKYWDILFAMTHREARKMEV